jgi:hypothetical protein
VKPHAVISKRTVRSTIVLALLLAASLCGCSRPAERLPAQYGLSETVLGRPVAEQAILFANLALPPDQPLRLQATWPRSGFFPAQTFITDAAHKAFRVGFVTDRGFDDGVVFTNAKIVPVFLIDRQSLGDAETAFVPEDCPCIFLNAYSLNDLYERFYLIGPLAASQHSSLDKAIGLSLVFLHELGHLHFGDRTSYSSNKRLDLAEINAPSAAISNPELRADAFASEIIRSAWASGEMHSALPGPYGRAAIASNILRVLSTGFNLYDVNHDPAGLLGGKPNYALFAQSGYSHLNLYLRLLIFLEQTEPSATRRQYLERISQAIAVTGTAD